MPDVGRKANPKNAHTQSVVFDSNKWDEKKAKAWCAKHGYVTDGMDKTDGALRFRQYDPDSDAFKYRTKDLGGGVSLVLGLPVRETVGSAQFADGVQYEWIHDEANDTYTLKGVEIFSVGKWNGQEYDESDIEQMADADRDLHDILRPRVKIGHGESGDDTAEPAFGWMGPIRKFGEKLLADIKSMPSELFHAIKKGLYARQSVEIRLNYKHPETGKRYPFAIDALAFLGAKLPAVGTLKPLAAFKNDGEGLWLNRDVEESGGADSVAGESAGSPEQRDFAAAAAAVETAGAGGDSMDEKDLKAREEKLAAEREELDKLRKQAGADREAVEEEKRRLHASKIDGYCERLLEAGKATPGELETFKAIAEKTDDAMKIKFADGEKTALEAHFQSWMARPDKGKNTRGSAAAPEGEPIADLQVFFEQEADKLVKDRGLSFANALGEVQRAHPDEYKKLHAERFKPFRGEK